MAYLPPTFFLALGFVFLPRALIEGSSFAGTLLATVMDLGRGDMTIDKLRQGRMLLPSLKGLSVVGASDQVISQIIRGRGLLGVPLKEVIPYEGTIIDMIEYKNLVAERYWT